jgi:hypothetical protein
MLDLTRTEIAPAPAESPLKETSVTRSTPLKVPRDTAPRRVPWRFEIGSGAALGYGWVPSVTLGAQLEVWVKPPGFWRTGITATRFAAHDEAVDAAAAGVSFRVQSLALAVCPAHYGGQTLALNLCAIERLAHVRAEAFGFEFNRVASEATLSLGALGQGSWQFWGPLRANVALSLEFPWVVNSFVYQRASGEKPRVFRTRTSVESLAVTLSALF